MPIIPDTKDWTWVLSQPCPECGFSPDGTTPATVASTLPTLIPRWQAVLRRPDAEERPDDETWSPLEYGAHVRDVFTLFDHRLHLMLEKDNPEFPDWDQDAAAVEQDYYHQDPEIVSSELVAAGTEIAESFAAVRQDDWKRQGRRSNGSVFTVETFSRYFLHDIVHHLHDVDG